MCWGRDSQAELAALLATRFTKHFSPNAHHALTVISRTSAPVRANIADTASWALANAVRAGGYVTGTIYEKD